MTNFQVLGSYEGRQLIVREDGTEMYYSTKTKRSGMSIRGVARLLGCDHKTIQRAAGTLGVGIEVQMYTRQGIQGVTLIPEESLNELFTHLLKSRCKQETKDRILVVQSKYVQAGFRLQVMLEVAPEEVAKEAISRIEDPDKAKEVANTATNQAEYLETFHGLGGAIELTGASHGAIHGHNNKLAGIPNGGRPNASYIQKSTLTVLQKVEELKLLTNKDRYKNGFHATNSAKKAGTEVMKLLELNLNPSPIN